MTVASEELVEQFALGVADRSSGTFNEMVLNVSQSASHALGGAADAARRAQLDARRREAEIDGLALLGIFVIERALDSPEAARKIAGGFEIYKNASSLVTNVAGLGTAALVAGWIGVGVAAVSLISQSHKPSFKQQLMKAVSGLYKAIETVFEVMQSRFDQVVENQTRILQAFQEGFQRLDEQNLENHGAVMEEFLRLRDSVGGLREYVEGEDRDRWLDRRVSTTLRHSDMEFSE